MENLFNILTLMFSNFGEHFSFQSFIFGTFYRAAHRTKSQLLNFLIGQAKRAIYITRQRKIEGREAQKVELVFKRLVKGRILIDFNF